MNNKFQITILNDKLTTNLEWQRERWGGGASSSGVRQQRAGAANEVKWGGDNGAEAWGGSGVREYMT